MLPPAWSLAICEKNVSSWTWHSAVRVKTISQQYRARFTGTKRHGRRQWLVTRRCTVACQWRQRLSHCVSWIEVRRIYIFWKLRLATLEVGQSTSEETRTSVHARMTCMPHFFSEMHACICSMIWIEFTYLEKTLWTKFSLYIIFLCKQTRPFLFKINVTFWNV